VTSNRLLADRVDAALPQTQCTRCGYADCRGYADAIAFEAAPINQCPPGGAEGIERLGTITQRPPLALNPGNGIEGPRLLAVIDEAWCIGCTLCLQACPVDCIVGGSKQMHTVIDALCTGCELCLPVCPVDCISLVSATGERTGWQAWTQEQADASRERYLAHRGRMQTEERMSSELDHDDADRSTGARPSDPKTVAPSALQRRQATIEAALARAKAARAGS